MAPNVENNFVRNDGSQSEPVSNGTRKSDVALREEAILEFWKENKIFEKSLEKSAPKGHYVFYDGPPFATGQIHYGHILGSTAKDVIGRYKTMQGYYVPRKWGWDCHGLPIENIVEKELRIAGHKEIEQYGVNKFVEYARSKVLQYDKDWEKGIERIGRWVDFRGSYKTMDNTFIESVWWALSELNKKNLIYEGVRVLAYCARCETPIANSEIAMDNSYKDIADISVYVKFELEDEPGTYLLAWTTTPWTLPGNTAIGINKNIVYVKIKTGDDILILAKETLVNVLKDKEYSVMSEIKAEDLVGKKYKPIFPYYKNEDIAKDKNIWKIWQADFVTVDQGSGIVHEAPAFGEDDMNLAKANSIPWIVHVDETGRFTSKVTDFAGMKVKPKAEEKDGHQVTDIEIIKYLAKNSTLFKKEKLMHSYPHCMRCDTPIIYYALSSWFINIQIVKKNIIKQADNINWIPSHLKEGRFKNIVENAPDWNISRNRYWASPLPIWKCEKCKNKTFVSSLADLRSKTKKSGNTYFVMRHGESESNIKSNMHGVVSSREDVVDHLTKNGIEQVKKIVDMLKNKKIDLIFVSPLMRTRETLNILKENLGWKDDQIIFDKRLTELDAGDFEGKPWDEYRNMFINEKQRFIEAIHHGESILDVKKRMGDVIYELEKKYNNKNILIISHGTPLWMLFALLDGYNVDESISMAGGLFRHSEELENKSSRKFKHFANAELREVPFVSISHNKDYELDLHRPYIDAVPLVCVCDNNLTRIPEVLDCWFESGSMPFAQDHYPFENKEWQKKNFPAGFVAEYVGQVRTWFYYTHAVSTMLFNNAPFKNIVTTGTLRAEDGEKMSKSKHNYPDPWIFIDKYGVDALRIYLMSSTLMKGEDANFLEKAVQDISSKIIGRLFNVLAFYELYRDQNIESSDVPKSNNILDQWILSRFDQVFDEITGGMEKYDMTEATRPIDLFVDDLSTWYLRRSRQRFKGGDKEAKQTLYFVLKNLAKLVAPLAPFTAEDIWLKLKNEEDRESVHLVQWPKMLKGIFDIFGYGKEKALKKMGTVRHIVTLGLEARQRAGIKVRQPLNRLEIIAEKLSDEYLEIIKDELNIKNINYLLKIKLGITKVTLDINITEELKQEGDYRELARALQDMRKGLGLTPSDIISLYFETNDEGKKLIQKFETEIKKIVLVSKIEFKENDGLEIKIDNLVFKVKIDK